MTNPVSPVETPESDLSAGADVAMQREVARIQSSGVLGEARLRNLFDYLAKSTLAGQSPKEMAIAIDVFGKTSHFDVAQDAVVRVYIHKLRKTLESFYAAHGAAGGAVLRIPRGDYRLRIDLENPGPGSSASRPGAWLRGRRFQVWGAAAVGVLALVGLGIGIGVSSAGRWTAPTDLERVRANPVWSGLLQDDRPIMIVLGDYYLVGETDESLGVQRLIREYSINSKSDLERFTTEHPEFAARYMDVGVRYLPISAALALRNVMVVLAPQNRRITLSKMSDLESGSLKNADIVYIGYLSGMGSFQDFVFSGSRLAIGESYDEVIDKRTQRSYVSGVGLRIAEPTPTTGAAEHAYHDYGVFEKLQGPGGNTILVIAGTRDEGVSQTAEAFTNLQKLDELGRQTDLTRPLEALLEVTAFSGTNLTGKLLLQANRDKAAKQ